MRPLLITAVAAALLAPATASASDSNIDGGNDAVNAASGVSNVVANANQYAGRVDPNSCSATQSFTVSGPAQINVLSAGTNAGGALHTQVVGPAGDVGSDSGYYEATAAGTYGFQVCFISDDGIDSTISYASMVVITPR